MTYQDRLLKAIPGGAHTYSRGFDQFPSNAPEILTKGKGVTVYDAQNTAFIDYGMALRAVNIGYAEDSINLAAIKQIDFGNNLTRPSLVELEAAERIINLIDSIDMVKFTKNGSSSVSAAVKIARAYTGRDMIARCAQHPFFSYDDWFIASTPIKRGIPKDTISKTKTFNYNDIDSLRRLIDEFPNEIACVVLEPSTNVCPIQICNGSFCTDRNKCSLNASNENNFLKQVQDLCTKNGIIFVLDEMITGFRWDLRGAQYLYDVDPDLTTFGKAMANGFSVSCVGGKKELMSLGSIENIGDERLFLLSTTHGAEMSSLGAFLETINFIETNNVISHIWNYGTEMIDAMNKVAKDNHLSNYFEVKGFPCSPYYETKDVNLELSLPFRTLFMQEMIKNGILMPWISLAYRHTEEILAQTLVALDNSLKVYKAALDEGIEEYLVGESIKPVFRKYN